MPGLGRNRRDPEKFHMFVYTSSRDLLAVALANQQHPPGRHSFRVSVVFNLYEMLSLPRPITSTKQANASQPSQGFRDYTGILGIRNAFATYEHHTSRIILLADTDSLSQRTM